jgi:hypothetical protein
MFCALSDPFGPGPTGLENTVLASHELAETVTDPREDGWFNSAAMAANQQGEIADLAVDSLTGQDGMLNGYMLTPLWSNIDNGVVAPGVVTAYTGEQGYANNEFAGRSFRAYVAGFTDLNNQTGPNNDTYYAFVNWGDGSGWQNASASVYNGVIFVNGTHLYAQPGQYTVGVALQRPSGYFQTVSGSMNVAAVPYTGEQGYANSATAGRSSSPYLAGFTDLNNPAGPNNDTYLAFVNWGDGSGWVSAKVSVYNGVIFVRGSHVYALSGQYVVGVALQRSSGYYQVVTGSESVQSA